MPTETFTLPNVSLPQSSAATGPAMDLEKAAEVPPKTENREAIVKKVFASFKSALDDQSVSSADPPSTATESAPKPTSTESSGYYSDPDGLSPNSTINWTTRT